MIPYPYVDFKLSISNQESYLLFDGKDMPSQFLRVDAKLAGLAAQDGL